MTGMYSTTATRSRLARLMAAGVLAVGAMGAWAGAAEAQAAISSTSQLKQACQTSPGNIVNVASDMKINSGATSGGFTPAYEQVNSGCTIQLAGGAKFETDGVAMAFNGPFNVQSPGKGSVTFAKSAVKAPSMAYNLPGADSDFKTDAARLDATVGNIDIKTGNDAELQFQYMGGAAYSVKAAGDLNISGGDKTFFNLFGTSLMASKQTTVDMKGRDATLKLGGRPSISGGGGLAVNLGGGSPSLSAEDANFGGGAGGVVISSPANKALAEIKSSRVSGGGNVAVRLPGSESALKSTLSRFQSETGRVDLLAGGPGSSVGMIELSDSDIYSTTGTSVQASPEGQRGVVKVTSGSSVRGGSGDVLIRSGAAGTTEVKNTAIWSSTIVRILTGVGGSCVAADNGGYISPAQQICP